jgi:hypothetical protein
MTQLVENTTRRPVLIATLDDPAKVAVLSDQRERRIARLKGEAAATKATADSARDRRGGESYSRSGPEQGKIARFPFLAVKEPSA